MSIGAAARAAIKLSCGRVMFSDLPRVRAVGDPGGGSGILVTNVSSGNDIIQKDLSKIEVPIMMTEKELKDVCMPLIHIGQFTQAKNIIQDYRREKGDYWSTNNTPLDLSENLAMIFFLQKNKHPRLTALDSENYKTVFDLVAYALLRGSGTPRSKKMTNVPGMTIGTAAKVMINYALTQANINNFKKSGVVVSVEVTGGGQPLCPKCKAVCGSYPINGNIPIIPNPSCTNPEFCNLTYLSKTIGMSTVKNNSPKPKQNNSSKPKPKPKKKSILDLFK